MLQSVVARCSALHGVSVEHSSSCSVLQCVAVCCSVLQCVAVCCSVLQCVAACCSVLQCVAIYCCVCRGVSAAHTSSSISPAGQCVAVWCIVCEVRCKKAPLCVSVLCVSAQRVCS